MNITFLVGNGFDLACGLKSSYPDIYEGYIKESNKSEAIKKFKEDLIANRTNDKWGNWSDFEMGMAEYSKNFNTEEEMIECISDFKSYLEDSLTKEARIFALRVAKLSKATKEKLQQYIIQSFSDFYKGLSNKITKKVEAIKSVDEGIIERNYINFNYTGVFDYLLKSFYNKNAKVVHIHGALNGHDTVLGVDNTEQIKALFPLSNQGKRVFVKPFFNNDYDDEKVEEVRQIIANSDCICVFGMSFGDSDLTWREEVVRWLKSYHNNHLFLYEYDCSNKTVVDASLKLNEEEKYKNKKLKELFGVEASESIFEQIHIPIGKSIFSIKEFLDKLEEKDENQKLA